METMLAGEKSKQIKQTKKQNSEDAASLLDERNIILIFFAPEMTLAKYKW